MRKANFLARRAYNIRQIGGAMNKNNHMYDLVL